MVQWFLYYTMDGGGGDLWRNGQIAAREIRIIWEKCPKIVYVDDKL